MSTVGARAITATAALVVSVAVSCSLQAQPETPVRQSTATKSAPSPVRHDPEPLTRRFPALGSPVAASWVSGVMGDPNMPGPSTYWLDAVVKVTPETVSGLKARYHPVPAGARPEVWQALAQMVPAGDYLTGGELDAAFTSPKGNAKIFLAQQVPVVVIAALSQ